MSIKCQSLERVFFDNLQEDEIDNEYECRKKIICRRTLIYPLYLIDDSENFSHFINGNNAFLSEP